MSRDVWLSIAAALGSSTRARCLNLLGQFQTLRQGDNTAAEYLGRAHLLVEQLALIGRPMSLDEQNLYVFRGLLPEFRSMAASLVVSGTPVSIPQLSDFLQAQEFIYADDFSKARVTSVGGSPQAMYAGRGAPQFAVGGSGRRGGGSGRGRNGIGRGGGRGGARGPPRCQICRSHEHTAVSYFKRYAPQPHAQANVAVTGDSLAASTADAWYPDTGATAHATRDASMIGSSEDYTSGNVLRVGNGTGLVISRVGHVSVPSVTVSKNLQLSNILHVPKLSVPLLSVHLFTNDNSVFFEFHKSHFVVKDSATKEILLKGPSADGLYKLSIPRSPVAFLSARATPTIWHNRLGHPHVQVLKRVLSQCPVSSGQFSSSGMCLTCQLDKSSRFPLDRVLHSANNVLDIVYMDI
ncbi:PREDICTED: uncharacterized protein LOC109169130 [Ipomoea nil]|uniref:uncharacterized protein LOC109169130 n=1 Tax=Ipomoea nil TaxID=35883 RepID=UPI000902016D|nr:PREDICTED: uncharacterized protein LOC109169130 [Ipomoea nil]